MDILELVSNAKDIYVNDYFMSSAGGVFVNNSVLLKYKYPDMFAEKVGLTIVLEDDGTITVIDWFKDDLTKDIANKLMNYFELLGYKVNMR